MDRAKLSTTIETYMKENGYGPALGEEAWGEIVHSLQDSYRLAEFEKHNARLNGELDSLREQLATAKAGLQAAEKAQRAEGGTTGPFCGHNGRQCMRKDTACLVAGHCLGLGSDGPSEKR